MLSLIIVGMVAVLALDAAMAQQPVSLTGWRAAVDAEVSSCRLSRPSHATLFAILQEAERAAATEPLRQPTDAQGQRHLAPPVEPAK